ncbi:MAG: hypothetical protein V5A64_04350 [Candidatus Thermoplasmatota archaeon]
MFFLNINPVLGYNSYSGEDVNESMFTNSSSDLGIVFLVVFVLFIGVLAAGIWVYLDAKKRGEPGGLWLTVVLISNYVGLIIWLIFRPTLKQGKQEDRKYIESNLNYSSIASTKYNTYKTDTRGRICTNCGRPIPFDAKLCPYCGKKFKSYI